MIRGSASAPAPAPAQLCDPELPALEALLGPAAAESLAPAVATAGGTIHGLSPRLVNYAPGQTLRVKYDATVEYPNGIRMDILGAFARSDGTPRGETISSVAGMPVNVWRCPDDPALPGLRDALDQSFVSELLGALGMPTASPVLNVRSYSPRSRAVVEVAVPGEKRLVVKGGRAIEWAKPRVLLYLKVRRPDRVDALRRTHEVLEPRLPIARCMTVREDIGVLAFAPLNGTTLWDAVRDAAQPPTADELLSVLERFEDVDLGVRSRQGARRSAARDAAMLKAVCPERADTIDRFLDSLGEDSGADLVTVHGDFHEVQVLVSGGRVSGLLDMDDTGSGQRLDDLAMLLGRLWCFARTEPDPGARVAAYASRLLEGFGRHVDRHELELRMAAVALCHATGPFRFQERGWRQRTRTAIESATELLARAHRGR